MASPRAVRIEDFELAPGAVSIDDSLADRLLRHHQRRKGQDVDSTPEVLAQHVQAAFSEALVAELGKANMPASTPAGPGTVVDATPPELVVSGKFCTIDEGEATRRMKLGFGADMTAQGNRKPGAAIASGGSLAAGAAKKAFGDRNAKVEEDAARMGTLAARQIGGLLSDPAWLPVMRVSGQGSGTFANSVTRHPPRAAAALRQAARSAPCRPCMNSMNARSLRGTWSRLG